MERNILIFLKQESRNGFVYKFHKTKCGVFHLLLQLQVYTFRFTFEFGFSVKLFYEHMPKYSNFEIKLVIIVEQYLEVSSRR